VKYGLVSISSHADTLETARSVDALPVLTDIRYRGTLVDIFDDSRRISL